MTNAQIIEALVEQEVTQDLIDLISNKLKGSSKSELSDKAKSVLAFLQQFPDVFFFASDIASELDIEARSLTGVLTGLVNKGYLVKETGEGSKKIYKVA